MVQQIEEDSAAHASRVALSPTPQFSPPLFMLSQRKPFGASPSDTPNGKRLPSLGV